jgi:hypothetical protein
MAMPSLPDQTGAPKETNAAALAALMQAPPPNTVSSVAAIRATPNYPFLLRHHRSAWSVETEGLDEPTLLPEINVHRLMPGCNGVRTRNENEPVERAYEDAVAVARQAGWIYLDPQAVIPTGPFLPAGVPAGPYIRRIPAKHPLTGVMAHRYVEAWNVPVETLPDEDQQFKFDRASYNRWRAELVLSGLIPLPTEVVTDRLRKRVQGHVKRIQARTQTDPQVKEANLARAREAADTAAAAEPPTKTPRKPKKPAGAAGGAA